VVHLGSISSSDNVHIKYVRSLQEKKRVRYREKCYIIEGPVMVAQALSMGYRPALSFYTEELAAARPDLIEELADGDARAWSVSPALMQALSETVTHQGVLAVLPMPEVDPDTLVGTTLLLVLDNIRDPGNLGTMMRTALATGVDALILSTGCVDPYSPKVVRAGMGAHLSLPILPGMMWEQIAPRLAGHHVVLADAAGEHTPWEIDWTRPSALIVGSEAHGAGQTARSLADDTVRLPMQEGVESLNAAIAAAVILFEAQRQRMGASLR
jgi:TrmH family RNA methyltransferase